MPGGNELFQPGDHLSVFPENSTKLVEELLECVDPTSITPDDHVTLEFNKGGEESNEWQEEQRFCQEVTVRDALAKYLDITTPPTPELLKLLAVMATNSEDSEGLQMLGKGEREYEEWKYSHYPNLAEAISCFPSLCGKIDPAFLLSQLPILQSVSVTTTCLQTCCGVLVHVQVLFMPLCACVPSINNFFIRVSASSCSDTIPSHLRPTCTLEKCTSL